MQGPVPKLVQMLHLGSASDCLSTSADPVVRGAGRSLPPPAQRVADALLLGPVLALGGHVTRAMLAAIDVVGATAAAAAECTHLVSAGALVSVALAAGLVIGVASLLLAQRLRTNKSNWRLLREDLAGIPGLVREWLFYGVVSSGYSRLAASDARVSYGA